MCKFLVQYYEISQTEISSKIEKKILNINKTSKLLLLAVCLISKLLSTLIKNLDFIGKWKVESKK